MWINSEKDCEQLRAELDEERELNRQLTEDNTQSATMEISKDKLEIKLHDNIHKVDRYKRLANEILKKTK